MAIDYSIYQKQYEEFSRFLSQISALGTYSGQSSSGQVTAAQSFSDAYENAVEQMTVSESMDAIFEEAAQIYHVPVKILKAVGKVESDFNPNAVSSAGAQGVMQLMPGTAKDLGVTDPFDVRQNIMGGAKELAQKLKKYNGDIDLTLAAYNAGSGTVAKYGGVPPFTRRYIEKVKSYMGKELTIGKTVNTKKSSRTASAILGNTPAALAAQMYGQSALPSNLQGSSVSDTSQLEKVSDILQRVKDGYIDYDPENAQYYSQLMRLQMQNQTIDTLGQLLSGDEEERKPLFEL